MRTRFIDTITGLTVPQEQIERELVGLLGVESFYFITTVGYACLSSGQFDLLTFYWWCDRYRIAGFKRFIYHDFLDGRYKFEIILSGDGN